MTTRPGYPPFSQSLGTATMSAAAATSTAVDLTQAGWTRLAVTYASFSTGAALQVQGSVDNTTFLNVHTLVPNSSAAQYQPLVIATSTSGSYAVFQAPPFRYVRFIASAAPDTSGAITIYGAD